MLRCISRDAEYCFMDLNTFMAFCDESGDEAHEIKCSRRFAIFVGSVKSDKNKRTFFLAANNAGLECLCLLFVVSGRFSSHRLSSKHLNCLHDT
jgi:hypothetical protein